MTSFVLGAADVNQDLYPDLISRDGILINDGHGRFDAGNLVPLGTFSFGAAESLIAFDADGDSDLDLLSGSR